MANKVFRKSLMDKLSSPEQLDKKINVVPPIGWVALVTIGILIVAALSWSIFGTLYKNVNGQGVLMDGEGIDTVTIHTNGEITDLSIENGSFVKEGQVLARISQDDLLENLETKQRELVAINSVSESLSSSNLTPEVYAEFSSIVNQIEPLEGQASQYNIQLDHAKDALEDAKETLNMLKTAASPPLTGTVGTEAEIEEAQTQVNNAQTNLETAQVQVDSINGQLADVRSQLYTQRDLRANDTERIIDELELAIENQGTITSKYEGNIIDMNYEVGEVIQQGQTFCKIISGDSEKSNTEVILYVSATEGMKIEEGMKANISPTTVNREEYGYIEGVVKLVSEYAVTQESMVSTLDNQVMAQALGSEGVYVEVRVELLRDSNTVSGYKWSTKNGAPMMIDMGTICTGEISVEEQRPIDMIIPYLKNLLFEPSLAEEQ